ncbi:ABC transporter substrate-binding protein [Alkalibaculum sp. M08DMB]|uniref:ABC transporter substrate-binding protein n=1 Tax=Alkalibaculum sporogenes TaxID=2655001 RepID=A0A6A7KAZ8_9FIRM|nr:ABC transporter substrate-binding protein [Alkalibaculum sporogenes]
MLVASILMFAGCSNGEKETSGDDSEVIKIGTFGPLTGPVAAYGSVMVNSAKLAIDEINENGGIDGKQIQLIDYDTKADASEAVNIYNKLRDQDEVVAIIGGTISGETLAVKELAIADGMPMLTPTATHLDVTLDAPSIFRACYTDPYQGAAIAKYSIENLDGKSAAILYNTDDSYSVGLAETYKESFEEAGLEITNFEGYTANEVDYSAILSNVKDKNPDIIFLPDYYDTVGKIATAIRNMGLEQIVVGVDGWDSVEINYAEQVEGYYFVNHFAKTDKADIVQNFISAYKTKYNTDPNALGALGYDAAYVLVEAIKAAGSTDSEAIVAALSKIEYSGVTGTIRFDDQGDVTQKDIAIIKIVDGDHELLEKIVVE